MMIGLGGYIAMHENDSFEQLIKERNNLVSEINKLEKIVFDENKTDQVWMIHPGPDVKYQMYLEYLAELCKFMQKKYNKKVVWGVDDEEETPIGSIEIR